MNNDYKKRQDVIDSTRSILVYALSFTVALGLNDLITTIFNSFSNTQHIITKTTYVVIMFGITLIVAQYLISLNDKRITTNLF